MTLTLTKQKRFSCILCLPLMAFLLSACNPAKRLQSDELLLDRNIIVQNGSDLNESEITSIVKQRTNVYSLTAFRLRLHVYNMGNPKRIERVNKRLNARLDRKNEKRKLINENRIKQREIDSIAGEKVKRLRLKKMKQKRKCLGEIFQSAGEAPKILDSTLNQKTNNQIRLYMYKKGYFEAEVRDSIVSRDNRATVFYVIDANIPYTIHSYKHEIEKNDHGVIHKYIDAIEKESLIHLGDRFDMDLLDEERERITTALRDSGFHFFNKEYIYYQYDTTESRGKIDLYMDIYNIKSKDPIADTIILTPHKRYTIGSIDLYTNFDSRIQNPSYEKLNYNNLDFYYQNRLNIKPKVLDKRMDYRPGEFYNHSDVESAFKRLSNLGLFKIIHMDFELDTDTENENQLRSVVELEPSKTKTFTMESDGTRTGEALGVEGSVILANKNLFKKAIIGEISLTGGLEAQKTIVQTDQNDASNDLSGIASAFNTVEISPRTSLIIPSYLFKFTHLLDYHTNPHTEIATSYNFQMRPDFTRNIFSFTGSTIINEDPGHILRFDWPEFSLINIYNESPDFLDRINGLNDQFLAASYQDHIISAARVSYEFTNQRLNQLRNNFYAKSTLEQAGNLLRWGFERSNATPNEQGAYEIFNTQFAQYVKSTVDVRYYRNFKKSQFVYRVYAGVGVPLENYSNALPFQKAFYGGGANGIRAWKARTLGPGAYLDSTRAFDKTGDMRFEVNAEVRFDVIDWIEGALFADAGNIWLVNEDSLRTNGHFNWKRSVPKEIALGGGIGLRMDLDFFLIRFDFALPLYNPAIADNSRWIFGKSNEDIELFFKPQLVLGIGYPF
ncbi:MAG: hypothetical protein CL833_11905 [Crocinitomicaceae bacterium]|nr:hypothetical protein [Crocinitomicaceae bacterium]